MTKLVGILNVTPDSFSDGGLYEAPEDAIAHAHRMFEEGAAIVDVGAESTAPGSPEIGEDEEWRRLRPILPSLIKTHASRLSIDTFHPVTAERALSMSAGRVIINDMSGMTNPDMIKVVVDYGARCVIGHIPGSDVHAAHTEELVGDIDQVRDDLLARKARLVRAGLHPKYAILDPGIGFGKEAELNPRLLRFAELVPGHDVMIGYSKKRFLGEHRMEPGPNLAAGRIAIDTGAAYLRVHDVAEHQELLD